MLTRLAIPSERLPGLFDLEVESDLGGNEPDEERLQHTAEIMAAALSGLTRLRELQLPGNMLSGNVRAI